MHKKIFVRMALTLVISYFMFAGVLYYRNTNTEAGRRLDPPNAACIQGVKNVRTGGNCRINGVRGYRQASFACLGGSRGELHSRGCLSAEAFEDAAKDSCLRMSNCSISTTPVPSGPPNCVQRPACLDEEPVCNIPEPTGGWCPPEVVVTITPTLVVDDPLLSPTPCAMPTQPFCPGGTITQTNIPNEPGICGFKQGCANSDPAPTSTPTPAEAVSGI